MKKETKAITSSKSKKAGKRGRPKEKVQISVRINEDVMSDAYDHIRETGHRITDLLERGLVLAMREERHMSETASRARFVWEHVGVATQRRMVRVAVLERLPEVRDLSALEECCRLFHLTGIDAVEEWPGYEKGLALVGQPSISA